MFTESASEVGVFVLFDKEVVFEREVSQYVFNAPVTVDISDAGITIPKGKLVRIGYYVVGADFGYPLAADLGPMAYLGGYAAQSMNGMIQAQPWSNDLGNIIISAKVKEGEEPTDPEEDLEIRGTVVDKDGNALNGITMKLYFEEPSGSTLSKREGSLHVARELSRAPLDAGTLVATTTTHSGGQYSFNVDSRVGKFVIKAEKEGYYPAQRSLDAMSVETIVADFILIDFVGSGDGLLRKHGMVKYGLGYKDPGIDTYGAVGFSEEETEAYVGYSLQTVSFYLRGTRADEVGVFVLFDGELVLEEIVPDPNFNNVTEVDLKMYSLAIPAGKELKIGYYVKGSDNGYPLAVDDGPMVPMGAYLGMALIDLDGDMKEESNGRLDYNLILSATVAPKDNELFSMGYYMLPFAKEQYRAGDKLVLTLNDDPSVTGVERPLDVQWFFNEIAYSTGDVISLEAGSYVIKAVLSFEEYTQTIVQEIFVL